MSFGGKNMKEGIEEGENEKEKRKKGEIKRENGMWKGKRNAK
jgi:hypothetical protein